MTSENQSNLRFSVEESVWFQKGQEVSNILSISLDPDIVIQEHDQYVSIRGALLLTGEYQYEENNEEDEAPDYTSVRLVNEVHTREDGISELSHKFPVDITIPKNRIQSLEEVYVAIESFDYEIPKRGCLQIVADLSISGIQGTAKREQEKKEEVEAPEVVVAPEVVAEAQEVVAEAQEVVAEANEEEPLLVRNSSSENEEEAEVELQYEHQEEEEEEEEETDLFVPFEVEARKEAYQEPEEPVVEEQQEVVTAAAPQIEVKPREEKYNIFNSFETKPPSVTAVEEREEPAANSKENNEVEEAQETKRDENHLTLTKIFTKNNEEEHLRMKICIVQNGDSLDRIAERYEISVQQLIRVNSLSPDHIVSEGELLYIPKH